MALAQTEPERNAVLLDVKAINIEVFMRKRFLLILITLLIFSLFLLACHVHLHEHGNDDESHCPFCALLNTGLSFSLPFKLFLFLTVLTAILINAEIILIAVKIFNNQLRAPPFFFD
jgi:hypothetical protein